VKQTDKINDLVQQHVDNVDWRNGSHHRCRAFSPFSWTISFATITCSYEMEPDQKAPYWKSVIILLSVAACASEPSRIRHGIKV